MKITTEIARFLLTALAVAVVVPTAIVVVEGASAGLESPKGFIVAAAICFFCAIAGGVVLGLPALWLATRLRWQNSAYRMTALGCLAGAVAGALGALLLNTLPGEVSFVTLLQSSVLLGAIAGLAAAPVWVLLHRFDDGGQMA